VAVTAHRDLRKPSGRRPVHGRLRPETPTTERPGHCRRCGGAVIACLDPTGTVVPVHPVPVVGGELIVNGTQNQIVLVLSGHEAAAAGRRNHLGYTVHARVCRSSRSTG
jgi:hypothetical protein